MGVYIKSKNYRALMGYGTYFRIRTEIAHKLDSDLGQMYATFIYLPPVIINDQYDKFVANNQDKLSDKSYSDVFNFLFEPDCEPLELDTELCEKLYELSKYETMCNAQNRNNSASFNMLLLDCIENKCGLEIE